MSANIAGSYKINGTPVLTSSGLGSGITSSSLTSLGTLSSLTVTGDVTIDSSTLKVDSTNNRVGIVKASPAYPLDVVGDVNTSTKYKIGGTDVLSSTTLGSTVVNSSLTSTGALSSLTVNGPININNGSAPTSGQIGYITSSTLGASTTIHGGATNLVSLTLSAGTWMLIGTMGFRPGSDGLLVYLGIQTSSSSMITNLSTKNVWTMCYSNIMTECSMQVQQFVYLSGSTTFYLNANTYAELDSATVRGGSNQTGLFAIRIA